MGLKHLKQRLDTVELSDGESFTVRGLGIIEITALVGANRETLSALFAVLDNGYMEAIMSDSSALIANAFAVVPGLVIAAIALGAGEDDLDLVQQLPIGVQIEAMDKIAKLTFASYSPTALIDTITRVMNGMTASINNRTPSKRKSGASSTRRKPRFPQYH